MTKVDEAQLAKWREEQVRIASQVFVPKRSSGHVVRKGYDRYRYIFPPTEFHGSGGRFEVNVNNGKNFNDVHGKNHTLLIGGVDVGFPKDETEDAIAVYVILKYANHPSLTPPVVVYRSHKFYFPNIPYIPSYLAFREIEPLCELISSQVKSHPKMKPDVIMVDGNGRWHERSAGIACFIGVMTGIPTVGVGKTFYSIDGLMKKDDILMGIRSGVRCCFERMVRNREMSGGGVVFMKEEDEKNGELEPLWRKGSDDFIECRGLIVDAIPISTSLNVEAGSNCRLMNDEKEITLEEMLTALNPVANGLAIPMNDNHGNVLAYALVGHGGSIRSDKKSTTGECGTKNPIYISTGSSITLEDAVALCAHVSNARVPEPVREADLYGRKILRERAKSC